MQEPQETALRANLVMYLRANLVMYISKEWGG